MRRMDDKGTTWRRRQDGKGTVAADMRGIWVRIPSPPKYVLEGKKKRLAGEEEDENKNRMGRSKIWGRSASSSRQSSIS